MKDLIHEIIIIATSAGTLAIKEIIWFLTKHLKTPKETRKINKLKKLKTKIEKMKVKNENI